MAGEQLHPDTNLRDRKAKAGMGASAAAQARAGAQRLPSAAKPPSCRSGEQIGPDRRK